MTPTQVSPWLDFVEPLTCLLIEIETSREEEPHPQMSFGGYFTTNVASSTPGATAYFYNSSLELIGQAPVQMPAGNNAWAWEGWSFDIPVSSVDIRVNSGQGRLENDYMQYDPTVVPEPRGGSEPSHTCPDQVQACIFTAV